MSTIELIATSTFGLEAVVKQEVLNLGYKDISVMDGKITFKADKEAIPKANLWLRTADRVLLKMGEFKALSFEELFEKTKSLPWDKWIPIDGKFTVTGKSVKSKLYSVPDCQSIVKKAVVEKLKQKYDTEWFPETGAEYTIQVALLKDIATITIDTSGSGLHKRGYRVQSVEAPVKETLAAALIQISYWNPDRLLLDPFCGSGTIPIEAAMIGKNIAPGLGRSFASEQWSQIGKDIWKKAKTHAFQSINQNINLHIQASDIDPYAIEAAKENAIEAGVDDCITFSVSPVSKVQLNHKYGVLLTNPPYGERIGQEQEVMNIYKTLGHLFKNESTWSSYIITSVQQFESFFGKKANRKRKLYNGRIKVDFYQYFGDRPPKRS